MADLDQAESNANPGLFFSFGDDPLDEEMYISSSMDANEKLGKATGTNIH